MLRRRRNTRCSSKSCRRRCVCALTSSETTSYRNSSNTSRCAKGAGGVRRADAGPAGGRAPRPCAAVRQGPERQPRHPEVHREGAGAVHRLRGQGLCERRARSEHAPVRLPSHSAAVGALQRAAEDADNAMELISDQSGNYVIQHVLQRGALHYRSAIIRHVQGNILSLSKHKFASNVVERCFVHGSVQEKSQLVSEICGTGEDSPLNPMVRDQYANYVVQRVLGAVNDAQRMQIINRLVEMVPNIRKVAYGKHIVARVEKLTGKVL
eukprot:1004851_1